MITDQNIKTHQLATDYDRFIERINTTYNALVGPIFETDASGLYDAYLAKFPEGAERQYHTCNCCRQFIERFGGLAIVNENGLLDSAIWDTESAPDQYRAAMFAMGSLVRRAKITMPFLSSATMYGTPINGERKDGSGQWHHFAIKPAASRVYKATPLKTAFQAASEKREEFGSVCQALVEYQKETVSTALRLLKNDQLGNSEAALGQAQFLADLHEARDRSLSGSSKNNATWRLVAAAPSGFCHPRSSMIATLLDDIAAGKTFEQARASWNAKMHPLRYQRPDAAPTAGAIKAAEEAFEKLGAALALKRRFARLDDILEPLWMPKDNNKPAATGGIFANVKTKDEQITASMCAPVVTMTWDKFSRTVLPAADAIEVYAPYANDSYVALTTAVDPDALPILQWDSLERRNPVGIYIWHHGSQPSQFGLVAGQYHKVNAVTLRPSMWFGDKFAHQGKGVIFIIDGAKDSQTGAGNALFPSTLKAEFHGMRSVIEAFSKDAELEGRDQASACGLFIGKESSCSHKLRVTSAGQITEYRLDRWD